MGTAIRLLITALLVQLAVVHAYQSDRLFLPISPDRGLVAAYNWYTVASNGPAPAPRMGHLLYTSQSGSSDTLFISGGVMLGANAGSNITQEVKPPELVAIHLISFAFAVQIWSFNISKF